MSRWTKPGPPPRTVAVTGASAGVGRATAVAFARQGCRVGLLARGRDGLDAVAKEVQSEGGWPLVIPVDVADPSQVDAAASQVEETLGPIDVWVNNAMATVFAPFADITSEEFKRATEVTYLGTVYGTMAALQRMLPRDRGTIVQVGSALAYRSIPLQSAYCGAKHAIVGFTDSLRTELLHDHSGVRLTLVHMPALNTPQFGWCRSKLPNEPQPVPPIFQPEVAGEAIVWAAQHAPREHWVGGSTVATILAQRFVPGALDRYLARTGYKAQQTNTRAASDRRANLFSPVPVDPGMHGAFDARAHARSVVTAVTERFARNGSPVPAAIEEPRDEEDRVRTTR